MTKLTPDELAAHYKVSTRTVARLTAEGMPSHLIRGRRRYDQAETDAWTRGREAVAPKTRLTTDETMAYLANVGNAAFSGAPRPERPPLPLAVLYRRRPSVKAKTKGQTPPWADVDAIAAIYEAARAQTAATGIEHHVDHEYPLRGRLVSGLHVETNLRVLSATENRIKNNHFLP